jgi:hypothetical protein
MRHWKLREGMKQGIIAWRPARFVSGVFQLLQLEHQQDKVGPLTLIEDSNGRPEFGVGKCLKLKIVSVAQKRRDFCRRKLVAHGEKTGFLGFQRAGVQPFE